MEPISGQIKARGYFTGYFRLLQATSLATSRAGTMPGPISKQSRDLANVRLQLKSGKTRGSNPRPLSSEEVHALEARRDHLQTEMANGRRQRIASRVNAHTTQEAEQTRGAILTELQPLTSLVAGSEANSQQERIKARCNQIALLQASNREDREAIRQERVAARVANAAAKATAWEAGTYKRRKTSVASGSTCAPSSPALSCASSWASPAEVQVGHEPDPAPQAETAAEKPRPNAQALLNEFLNKQAEEDVDRIMAEIDARRAKASR